MNFTVYFVGVALLVLGLAWVVVTTWLAYRYFSLLQRERDLYRNAYLARLGVADELQFSASGKSPLTESAHSPQPVPDQSGSVIVAGLRKGWGAENERAFSAWSEAEFPGGMRYGIRVDDATIMQAYFDRNGTRTPLDVYRV